MYNVEPFDNNCFLPLYDNTYMSAIDITKLNSFDSEKTFEYDYSDYKDDINEIETNILNNSINDLSFGVISNLDEFLKDPFDDNSYLDKNNCVLYY